MFHLIFRHLSLDKYTRNLQSKDACKGIFGYIISQSLSNNDR